MRRLDILDDLERFALLSPVSGLLYVGKQDHLFDAISGALGSKNTYLVCGFEENDFEAGNTASDGLQTFPHIFSDKNEVQPYFVASNRAQSGLVKPELLRSYWQNLVTVEEDACDVTTIDRFIVSFEATSADMEAPNWLVIDCLPAGRILAGASDLLPKLDGVVVRALLSQPDDDALHDSTLRAVEDHLTPLGFVKVSSSTGLHAAFGHVVFARDWKRVLHAELTEVSKALGASQDDLVSARRESADTLADNSSLKTRIAKLKATLEKTESERDVQQLLSSLSQDVRESRHLLLTSASTKGGRMTDLLTVEADTYYKAGDFKRAAEYYQAVYERADDKAWAAQGLAESIARLSYESDPHWFSEGRARQIEDTGKWDVAVRLYRKALALNPEIGCAFNAAHMPSVRAISDDYVANPVFVVGCGHSGTSILLRVLGNHPDLMPIPKESAIFLRTDKTVQDTMAQWDKACVEEGNSRWIEKTPPHIFQIDRFLAMRPEAQFILIVRDGRDVVCSLRKRPGYESIGDRIDRWVYDNMAGLPFWDHPQVHVVKYEDFVADTERVASELCAFLKIEMTDALLNYREDEVNWYSAETTKPDSVKSQADHMNLRNWQINQSVFDGRGKWVEDMTAAEKKVFKASPAQKMLVDFGYVDGDDW